MEFFGSPTRTFKVRQDDDEGRDISTPFTTASLGTLGFTDAPPAPRKTKKSPNSALLCISADTWGDRGRALAVADDHQTLRSIHQLVSGQLLQRCHGVVAKVVDSHAGDVDMVYIIVALGMSVSVACFSSSLSFSAERASAIQ